MQVLTIHRSKGLQYTAVYLPCLNSDKQKIAEVRVKDPMVKTDEQFIPEWVLTRPKTEVCEADPATLEVVLTKERTAAAYENLCRIYVGMTRAIRRLVLVTDEIELESREQLTDDKMERKYDFATLIEAVLGGLLALEPKLSQSDSMEPALRRSWPAMAQMIGSPMPSRHSR